MKNLEGKTNWMNLSKSKTVLLQHLFPSNLYIYIKPYFYSSFTILNVIRFIIHKCFESLRKRSNYPPFLSTCNIKLSWSSMSKKLNQNKGLGIQQNVNDGKMSFCSNHGCRSTITNNKYLKIKKAPFLETWKALKNA